MTPANLGNPANVGTASRPASVCRVLFLDDEQLVLDGLARQLRNIPNEWQFDFSSNPEDALQRVIHRRYDIVVSDMCMPGMRGDEWLRQVQAVSPDTVRIALSGNTDQATTIAALNAGHVFHFLVKPCARDELLRILEMARRQRQLVVSERELLQTRLEHAERIATVGQFTAGIVHDLNNFLGVALNASAPRSGIESREALALIHTNARRMCELTAELMAFCRRDDAGVFRTVDLSSVIQSCTRLLGPALMHSIELRTEVAHGLPPVSARPSQLKQLLTNLILNARDAMPTGGHVTVTAEHCRTMRSLCNAPPAGFVCVSVRDDGCGMDAVTRRRLFEPFFTTKPGGKGTGLGLALVKQIADQHRGHIEIETAPGIGTTFRIYFPVAGTGDTVRHHD